MFREVSRRTALLQFMWFHDSHLMRSLSNEGEETTDKFIAVLCHRTHGKSTAAQAGRCGFIIGILYSQTCFCFDLLKSFRPGRHHFDLKFGFAVAYVNLVKYHHHTAHNCRMQGSLF